MGLFGTSDEDLLDYMGVKDEDRDAAQRRAARRQNAKPSSLVGMVGQAAGSIQDVLQRDVQAKFIAARQEDSNRNREEVETVTTTTKRNIQSRHHNHDAGSQWDKGGPSMG